MIKKLFTSLLCLSFAIFLTGQDSVLEKKRDTGFWQAYGISVQVNKMFKVYLDKELRYENKFNNLESDLYGAGVRIRLSKWAALRGNYRYTLRAKNRRMRFDLDLLLDWSIKPWHLDVDVRSVLQREYVKDNVFNDSEWEWRNRLKVTYTRWKMFQPYVGLEIFSGLGDNAYERNKLRFSLGLDCRLKKRFTITPFYHFQKDTSALLDEAAHILGMKFGYSF